MLGMPLSAKCFQSLRKVSGDYHVNSLFAVNVLDVILNLLNSESMEEFWLGKIFLERLCSQHCALRRFSEQILLWLSGG